MRNTMKIGELAHKAHCSAQTIRFYEKSGLLPEPGRNHANYRHYHDEHLKRLRFIRNCRSLDMTHDEIRALLSFMDEPQDDCTPVNGLLDEHIGHVNTRLAELENLRTQLIELRQRCAQARDVPNCGIIRGLTTMDAGQQPASGSHLG